MAQYRPTITRYTVMTTHFENLFMMIQSSIQPVFLSLKNSHLKVDQLLHSVATSLS